MCGDIFVQDLIIVVALLEMLEFIPFCSVIIAMLHSSCSNLSFSPCFLNQISSSEKIVFSPLED